MRCGRTPESWHENAIHLLEFEKMRDRPLIQRRLCRRSIRRQMSSATENQRDSIRVALADQAIFETVYEEAMNHASLHAQRTDDFHVSIAEDGSPIVDNLLKLLEWFVENGPELVRMIELIIGLFGNAATAAAVCEIERA